MRTSTHSWTQVCMACLLGCLLGVPNADALFVTRTNFIRLLLSTSISSSSPSSSFNYSSLPKPLPKWNRNSIFTKLDVVDIYGIAKLSPTDASVKLLRDLGLYTTRLAAEERLKQQRREEPGGKFYLAEAPLGEGYYKCHVDSSIPLNVSPSSLSSARSLLRGVPSASLPPLNALNGAVPLFFDESVRVGGPDEPQQQLVLFFNLEDLKTTFEGLKGGEFNPRVTDLQSVVRDLEDGGPSDFTRVTLRGDMGTRNGGGENVILDLIEVMEGKGRLEEEEEEEEKEKEEEEELGGGDVVNIFRGARGNM